MTPSRTGQITLRGVTRRFGNFTALDEIGLEIAPGELVALLGPSGSGKTTLLRIVAGLDRPDAGAVLVDGADHSARSARERRVGFVFQHFALFRHMTVFENIAFGLRVRPRGERPREPEIRKRVGELLDLIQLADYGRRLPTELSGGQRQRVALARALAIEPRLLLLDEPFAALDAKVRKELGRWLRALHHRVGVTSLLVTHDQEEALDLADRVVVMNEGRIEQIGTPREIYADPGSPFVFDFLGEGSRLSGEAKGGVVTLPGGSRLHAATATANLPDGPSLLFLRPHDVDFALDAAGTSGIVLHHATLSGNGMRLEARMPSGETLIGMAPHDAPAAMLPVGSALRPIIRRALVYPSGRTANGPPLHLLATD